MFPTADHYAAAIVHACRETGENPITCATPWPAGGKSLRARHYAMWAIIHHFPDVPVLRVAALVGNSKPGQFYSNSRNLVARPRNIKTRPSWWDDAALDRVIRAVEAIAVEKTGPAEESRPAPRRSIPPRLSAGSGYVSTVPFMSEKARLAAQLAEAVRNTAALQKRVLRDDD